MNFSGNRAPFSLYNTCTRFITDRMMCSMSSFFQPLFHSCFRDLVRTFNDDCADDQEDAETGYDADDRLRNSFRVLEQKEKNQTVNDDCQGFDDRISHAYASPFPFCVLSSL